MKRVYYLLLLLLTMSSCSYTATVIDNNYRFTQAKSPFAPNEVDVNQCYQDEYVTIEMLQVTNETIVLTVENNHDSTIRILWDEAAFVDFNGFAHKIGHDGNMVKRVALSGTTSINTSSHSPNGYSSTRGNAGVSAVGQIVDYDKSQVSGVIPAHSRIKTVIEPIGVNQIIRYVNVKKEVYNDDLGTNVNAMNALNRYKSRTDVTAVKLILPFEVDGEKKEYTLTFKDEFKIFSSTDVEGSGVLLFGSLGLAVIIALLL